MKSTLQSITAGLLLASPLLAADDFRFVKATVENTTLADGTQLKTVPHPGDPPAEISRDHYACEVDSHWHWQEGFGSGPADSRGTFFASGKSGSDCPVLRTTVAGLKPGSVYDVYGFFWVAGYPDDKAIPKGAAQWDVRFGLGLADLLSYGYRDNSGFPGTIGPGNPYREVLRNCDSPLQPAKPPLVDRQDDKRLFRVRLGTEAADANGTLIVNVDDRPGDPDQAPTCYDGIGVMELTGVKARVAAGAPGSLHLAVRAGDWEMARRELAAGADPNTLDKDGLTPLFYAVSYDDREHVTWLLNSGAKPDVDRQALTPLWAAATTGDAEIAKTLLKAGAAVPSGDVDTTTLAICYREASLLHPAVAAIRSGSLEVLKLILEKQPALNLDALFESDMEVSPEGSDGVKKPRKFYDNGNARYAVGDAVQYHHPEMAEFLIRHGCRINGDGTGKAPDLDSRDAPCRLLLSAIQARPAMTGVIDALIEKGWPMTSGIPPYLADWKVIPWDGLSGAMAAGETELAARFIAGKTDLGEDCMTRLTLLAESSGEPATVALLKRVAPDFESRRLKSGEKPEGDAHNRNEALDDETLRLLLPRERPPARPWKPDRERVIAVICDPQAEGLGTLLAVEASKLPGWKVVERGEIETLLQEQKFSKPFSSGQLNLSALGDRLSADVVILASMLGRDEKRVLRFEAVDVLSGLALRRRHVEEKSFKADAFSKEFLAEIQDGLQQRHEGKGLTAVTLLGLTADRDLVGKHMMEQALNAGVLGIIDSTPGMISLTRDQMHLIAEEKTFHPSEELWNAAWTIEGGVSSPGNGRIELGLRLRSLAADGAKHDEKASGTPGELPRMIREVWTALLKSAGNGASPKQRDPTAVAAEAARLLREAEWLMATRHDHEAAGMLESALLLGADPLKSVDLLIYARYRISGFILPNFGGTALGPRPYGPRAMTLVDKAAPELEETLDLLRFAHQSLIQYQTLYAANIDSLLGAENLVRYLASLRSALQPVRMDAPQKALLEQFDNELDAYVRLLTRIGLDHKHRSGVISIDLHDDLNVLHYAAVPALQDAAAELLFKTSLRDSSNVSLRTSDDLTRGLFFDCSAQVPQKTNGRKGPPAYRYSKQELIFRSLERLMKDRQTPYESIRRAEIAFLRSSGSARTIAARALLQARMSAKVNAAEDFYEWVAPFSLERWVPMLFKYESLSQERGYKAVSRLKQKKNYRAPNEKFPANGHLLLPGLIQHPQPSPDLSLRQECYREATGILHLLVNPKYPFRQSHFNMRFEAISSRVGKSLAGGTATDETTDLLEGAGLLDVSYGWRIRRDIEKRFSTQLAPQGAAQLVADKVVDLRDESMAGQAAIMTCPVIDPVNKQLLWFRLQSTLGWNIGASSSGYPVNHPWLMALDCSKDQIAQRVDLAKCPGLLPPGGTPEVMKYGDAGSSYNHLIFGQTAILVSVYWRGHERGNGPRSRQEVHDSLAVVLIDRKSGKSTEVPGLPVGINYGSGGAGDTILLATAVGDSFFALASPETKENFDDDSIPPCLWQIKPDGTVKMLTKPGRRPELTPFDAIDRSAITALRHDGGRLLVSSRDNHHYYDPKKETWEAAPPWNKFWKYVGDLDRADLHSSIFPHHILKMNDGGKDVYFDSQSTKSGRLACTRNGGPMLELPLLCNIPEDYPATFGIGGKSVDGVREAIALKDLIAQGKFHIMILNQTDTYFILGMSFEGVRHAYQTCVVRGLPFVWMVDKEKIRQAIKTAEETGK